MISSKLVEAGLIEKVTRNKDLKEMRQLVHYMDICAESTLCRETASTKFLGLTCVWCRQGTAEEVS